MEIVSGQIKGLIEWSRESISQASSGLWEGGVRSSWKDLLTESIRVAGVLRRAGIIADDVVSVQFPNGRQLVVLHLALARLVRACSPSTRTTGRLK